MVAVEWKCRRKQLIIISPYFVCGHQQLNWCTADRDSSPSRARRHSSTTPRCKRESSHCWNGKTWLKLTWRSTTFGRIIPFHSAKMRGCSYYCFRKGVQFFFFNFFISSCSSSTSIRSCCSVQFGQIYSLRIINAFMYFKSLIYFHGSICLITLICFKHLCFHKQSDHFDGVRWFRQFDAASDGVRWFRQFAAAAAAATIRIHQDADYFHQDKVEGAGILNVNVMSNVMKKSDVL